MSPRRTPVLKGPKPELPAGVSIAAVLWLGRGDPIVEAVGRLMPGEDAVVIVHDSIGFHEALREVVAPALFAVESAAWLSGARSSVLGLDAVLDKAKASWPATTSAGGAGMASRPTPAVTRRRSLGSSASETDAMSRRCSTSSPGGSSTVVPAGSPT